jgi:Recombination endonuclease VII
MSETTDVVICLCCSGFAYAPGCWCMTDCGYPSGRMYRGARMCMAARRCDICSAPFTSPVVDHCHVHGIVRGRLCSECNNWAAASSMPGWYWRRCPGCDADGRNYNRVPCTDRPGCPCLSHATERGEIEQT